MGKIVINGRAYNVVCGDSVSIDERGAVTVNKEDKYTADDDAKEVNITISGDCGNITARCNSIKVEGNVLGSIRNANIVTVYGNVQDKINADVIICKDVGGDITAGGLVSCNNVSGSIKF